MAKSAARALCQYPKIVFSKKLFVTGQVVLDGRLGVAILIAGQRMTTTLSLSSILGQNRITVARYLFSSADNIATCLENRTRKWKSTHSSVSVSQLPGIWNRHWFGW